MQVNSITIKNSNPSVRFSQGDIDALFPSTQAEPIAPNIDFASALEDVESFLFSEYSLSSDFTWRLNAISFVYDDEDYRLLHFEAKLSGFSPDLGKQTAILNAQSEQNVHLELRKKLLELIDQAMKFVGGASAQGNLFDSSAA